MVTRANPISVNKGKDDSRQVIKPKENLGGGGVIDPIRPGRESISTRETDDSRANRGATPRQQPKYIDPQGDVQYMDRNVGESDDAIARAIRRNQARPTDGGERYEMDSPFELIGGGREDFANPIYGGPFIGQPVPPPEGVAEPVPDVPNVPTGAAPPSGGSGGSSSSDNTYSDNAADASDIRTRVEGILDDPTSFLTDNNLNQEYTPITIGAGEIQDPDKFALDSMDPGVASTITGVQGPNATEVDTATARAGQGVARSAVARQGTAYSAGRAAEGSAAGSPQVMDFQAALIDPSNLTKALDEVSKLAPMKAASMAEKLDGLLADLEDGNVPVWARPAVTQVERMLAGRGITASSVGRDSLFNAIIQSAMPIAQQDATFQQESYKTTYQSKVQAILSDVNMEFAAKQFNANSINQTNQVKAQLQMQADMQAAARADAMSQFNAQQKNSMAQFNANLRTQVSMNNAQMTNQVAMQNAQLATQTSLENARLSTQVSLSNAQMTNQMAQFNESNRIQTGQFNAQMDLTSQQFNASQINAMTQLNMQLQNQRDQFNSQMAAQIEQSNVNWRRQVNQANTAGINAVNQANVQNAFNLSNQALTFLWQEMRDNAHWDFQASQAEKDRKAQLEAQILANETAMGGEIGKTLERIINGSGFLQDFLSDIWD